MFSNEHSQRVLTRMIASIRDYKSGESTNLRGLVVNLEGGLNALEEELPEYFRLKWFCHWGGLEQVLAAGTEKKRLPEILQDLNALETLLATYLAE